VTDETTHTDEAVAADHADDAHGAADHGTDEHGHGGEALGPIDVGKWAFAIAGAIGGLLVIAFFFVALGGQPV
jgi:hypothetical protein